MIRLYKCSRCNTVIELERQGVVILPFRPWCPRCGREMDAVTDSKPIIRVNKE